MDLGLTAFLQKIVDSFLVRSGNEGGYVANSRAYLLRARELQDFALTLMKAVAADPRAAEQLHELATKH